jgi:glucose-6-phosphate 1-epimerase
VAKTSQAEAEILNGTYADIEAVSFEVRDELTLLHVDNQAGTAEICLQGAQLLTYAARGQHPVVWTSAHTGFRRGASPRGGIPVCWPWFGNFADNPASVKASVSPAASTPAHGLVRDRAWTLEDIEPVSDELTVVTFTLNDDTRMRTVFPHGVQLKMRFAIGTGLEVCFEVSNWGDTAFCFATALHTYFAVSHICQVQLLGLEGMQFADKVGGGWAIRSQEGPMLFKGETDAVFTHTPSRLEIDDKGWERRIVIETEGSRSCIVWNPWIEKSRQLSNFGDEEYQEMLCVESANAQEDFITLQPGQSHLLRVNIRATG